MDGVVSSPASPKGYDQNYRKIHPSEAPGTFFLAALKSAVHTLPLNFLHYRLFINLDGKAWNNLDDESDVDDDDEATLTTTTATTTWTATTTTTTSWTSASRDNVVGDENRRRIRQTKVTSVISRPWAKKEKMWNKAIKRNFTFSSKELPWVGGCCTRLSASGHRFESQLDHLRLYKTYTT